MSVVRAKQCVPIGGEKARHWPGRHFRHWREERDESRKALAEVDSERICRSRETVKAWLESSPTSVLEDLDDESAGPSSLDSFDSSPTGSIEHLSYTTRFPIHASKSTNPSGHARSRTISPPRSAYRNAVDLSRIDPAHYTSEGSFLVLAFKNAQHRGASAPPVFQHASGDEHVQCLRIEACGNSQRSEFSLTSEWQNMLAAGTAAGASTGSNSEYETPGEELALHISNPDLDSDAFDPKSPAAVKLPHRRTRSMELPDAVVAEKSERQTDAVDTIFEQAPARRLSRRNSKSFNSRRETLAHTEERKLISRNKYEREEREMKPWEAYQREKATSTMKHAELKLEVKNDIATARRKAEEKKAVAEAKRGERAAREATTITEANLVPKRIGRIPRGIQDASPNAPETSVHRGVTSNSN